MAVIANWATSASIAGPEDFALDLASGSPRLLVSSQERRFDGAEPPGAIYSVPIDADGAFGSIVPLALIGRDSAPFHPHGISLVQGAGGAQLLYVINHVDKRRHRIEVYRVEGDSLTVDRPPLESKLLVSPNDLAALTSGDVYVTNSAGKRGLLGKLEQLFGWSWSNVVRWRPDGQWEIAARKIAFANGVEVSRDGSLLFVAGFRDKGIHVYPRDATGAIGEETAFIPVGSGVDNLMWEDETTLDVAAHPSMRAFLGHYKNAAKRSPSEVFRVNVRERKAALVFRDDGAHVNAASTALFFAGRWYIGRVFDAGVVSAW